MENRCKCCGAIIPDGRHVCSTCYREKFFPVIGGDGKCRPTGVCLICGEPFFEVELLGWVRPNGKQNKRYFHVRCYKGETDGNKNP